MTKWMLVFEPAAEQTAALAATLRQYADALVCRYPDIARIELDLFTASEHRLHTGRDSLPAWRGFVSLWLPPALTIDSIATPPQLRVHRFRLAEHTARDFSRYWNLGERGPGIKKLVFWSTLPGLAPALWQQRYRNHVDIAFIAHNAWKYRQNLVLEQAAGCRYDALSENWWEEPAGLIERFYASPAAEALVSVDTDGFIDKPGALTIVVDHTIVRD